MTYTCTISRFEALSTSRLRDFCPSVGIEWDFRLMSFADGSFGLNSTLWPSDFNA